MTLPMDSTRDSSKPSVRQKTISQMVTFVGVGLHRGETSVVKIRPAPEHSGIEFFVRNTKADDPIIPARWFNVKRTDAATTLSNESGVNVSTVEHIMAALYGLGIDNALVELDGPEVPILDGSAAPYTYLLRHAGIVEQKAPQRAIYIFRPIEVRDGDRFAMLLPSLTPRVTVSIDFPGTPVGSQTHSVVLTPDAFAKEIAPARTFGLEKHLTSMRERGLIRGASVKNAILVRDSEVISEEPLRFEDEFVRHKILDVIGDLALAGAPIYGHVYCNKPGHDLNISLLESLFENRESWTYVTVDDMDALYGIQTAPAMCYPNQFANVCEQ